MTDKITLKTKVQLMDEATVQRTLMRLSYEIIEKNPDTSKLALVGIETRGVPMAEILRNNIRRNTGIELPLGSINIKYYRDDLEKIADNPQLQKADLPFSVDGMHIILVDDVLYTGRTVRAAIEALFDLGRPAKVSLDVLVDRGHRELPIRPDYVGKNVPTSNNEVINVHFNTSDGLTNVEIKEKLS
ncbi:MAG: bifunctional pyr operon transcriptional regulator/uracil phosphoribosyltransferase PyrR [Erysipelotrichaceae bacterium]|nr:bifunctional pyr operon transcriptional regulator/uracil phosphoribosyltransferase PyrR [Erysipelotrichaceae bacterium]